MSHLKIQNSMITKKYNRPRHNAAVAPVNIILNLTKAKSRYSCFDQNIKYEIENKRLFQN